MLGNLFGVILGIVTVWYAMAAGSDFVAIRLKVRYWALRSMGIFTPPYVRLQSQMVICHHYLEQTSPTNILREYMRDREIPAVLENSSLIDFYENVFKKYRGITSSVLNHKEGKTLSSLTVLSKI